MSAPIRLSDMSTENEFKFHHGEKYDGCAMDAPCTVDAGSARFVPDDYGGFVAREFVFLPARVGLSR